MVYKFTYTEAVLEFVKNQGRAYLEAPSPQAALNSVRELFDEIRDEKVESLGSNQYLVNFKVSLDYRLPMLRLVQRAVKILRDRKVYESARYLDRYILAILANECGAPKWLLNRDITILEEISTLRRAAIVAREIGNVREFVDWDIVIHNYIELNSKEGHRSRVFRNKDESTV